MPLFEQFKASLRELRRRAGWTQEEVAQKMGIGVRGYQRIEQTGKTTATTMANSIYTFATPLNLILN